MDKQILETIRSFATEEQIKGITVFNCPIQEFEKDDIVRMVIHLTEELEKARSQHARNLDFLGSIRRAPL